MKVSKYAPNDLQKTKHDKTELVADYAIIN